MRTVIIPTINEEENIGRIIEAVYRYMGDEVAVLVIDDNSSDGTHAVVQSAAVRHPLVRLVVRRNERGLGTAIRRGAQEAAEGPVVVMDADFSHDVTKLPMLFAGIEEGYDVVVGSRYMPGGKTVGWPAHRILVSRGAMLIAKLLLGAPLKDSMSNYAAFRSGKILVRGVHHSGYKYLLEVLATVPGLRVKEVPIVFRDRTRGSSKLGGKTILLYLSLVLKMIARKQRVHVRLS
jgi:dolichol-phosphate mannosyltransferase